jgi:hypothetical protein
MPRRHRRVEGQLSHSQTTRLIKQWPGEITCSREWGQAVDENLKTSEINVLVTSTFMDSNYAYEKEMSRALERLERGEVCIVPAANLWARPLSKVNHVHPQFIVSWYGVLGQRREAKELKEVNEPRGENGRVRRWLWKA